jgi:hypothetical protein
MRTLKLVTVLSVAGAMSLASYVPVQAAPITPLSTAAKPSAQDGSAIQVRWGGWRGGGWGWRGGGWGVGALAAGAVIGAAIASPYAYGGYYPYSGYGSPYYGYGPAYGYSYPYGYSTAYYPGYSYGYGAYPRYYAGPRPYWRSSYGMYGVRPYRGW